jgi:SAM-dependent methyltransferase
MKRDAITDSYTPDWYRSHQELAKTSAAAVVPVLMEWLRPSSVVDVGCGIGEWLAAFHQAGVGRCVGVDGDYVSKEQLRFSKEWFVVADLGQPLNLTASFDLAICLEVVEHLPAGAGIQTVDWLCRHANIVLFSAAIPYQRGANHVNEQWPDYWQEKFVQHGFVAVDCLRDRFWNDPSVAWYYCQNFILYVRKDNLSNYSALSMLASANHAPLRRLVHPTRYLQTANVTPNQFHLKEVLRALPQLIAKAYRNRLKR